MSTRQTSTVSISPDLMSFLRLSTVRLAGMKFFPLSVLLIVRHQASTLDRPGDRGQPSRWVHLDHCAFPRCCRRLAPGAAALYSAAESIPEVRGKGPRGALAALFRWCRRQRVHVAETGADQSELCRTETRQVRIARDRNGAAEDAGKEPAEVAVVAEATIDRDRAVQWRSAVHRVYHLSGEERDPLQ